MKRVVIFSIVILILLVGGSYVRLMRATNLEKGGMEASPLTEISAFGGELSSGIYDIMMRNHLSFLDDTLTKVDIILSDDPRYAAYLAKYDPHLDSEGIFLVDGRIKAYPSDRKIIRALDPPAQIYFTLGNKVVDPKVAGNTNLTELIMIVVNIKRDICSAANKGFGLAKDGSIPKLTVNVNLTPNTKHVDEKDIVTLPLYAYGGCYEGLDGKLYYMQGLIMR